MGVPSLGPIARDCTRRLVILLACAAFAARAAAAQIPDNLAHASLEDLMKIQVSTASRTEQRAEDVAAALFVVTRDDIERSGLTSIPEILRLVPGLQVARIDGNKWAVAARGFNDLFSNKLLVLVDGRSIYNRSFSGVFWEDLDLALQDVDRIEVVKGPGGAVWGANAVNGVINIVTRPAAETQGAVVSLGVGTLHRSQVEGRYGGALGSARYRAYVRHSTRAGTLTADGADANDDWTIVTGGGRADWERGADSVSVQSSVGSGGGRSLWRRLVSPAPDLPLTLGDDTDTSNVNLFGQWTRQFSGGSAQVQSFYSYWTRRDGEVLNNESVRDVNAQVQRALGGRHTLMFGAEARAVAATFEGGFNVSSATPRTNTSVNSLFVQDMLRVSSRLQLIAGLKTEHDSVTGWNAQPTLRGMWSAGSQHAWAAVSRAVRTPSILDLSQRVNVAAVATDRLPILIAIEGNPDYQPERLLVAEAGYRAEPHRTVSIDAAIFRGRYNGLATNEPLPPAVETTPLPVHLLVATRLDNLLRATSYGGELSGRWVPNGAWRFDASYARLSVVATPLPASRDLAAAAFDGNAPANQWQLHGTRRVSPRLDVSGSLYFTGRLRAFETSAFTRADARAALRLTSELVVTVTGQNLSSGAHVEYADFQTPVAFTRIPRSYVAQLTWSGR